MDLPGNGVEYRLWDIWQLSTVYCVMMVIYITFIIKIEVILILLLAKICSWHCFNVEKYFFFS